MPVAAFSRLMPGGTTAQRDVGVALNRTHSLAAFRLQCHFEIARVEDLHRPLQ
jgi:hypothetical protein